MPHCYICDTYTEECIIDPKTHKLRHCSACEVVIQDVLDSYEAADRRKAGEPLIDNDFDDPELDALISEAVVLYEAHERTT